MQGFLFGISAMESSGWLAWSIIAGIKGNCRDRSHPLLPGRNTCARLRFSVVEVYPQPTKTEGKTVPRRVILTSFELKKIGR